jgi:hypothetical protein
MIDRQLPGPVAQPFDVPAARTLWFSGDTGRYKYGVYASTQSPEIVMVVDVDGAIIRETADLRSMATHWLQQILIENIVQ